MTIKMNACPEQLLDYLDVVNSSRNMDDLHIAANIIRNQLRCVKTSPDTSLRVEQLNLDALSHAIEHISHNELLDSYITLQEDDRSIVLRDEIKRRLYCIEQKETNRKG